MIRSTLILVFVVALGACSSSNATPEPPPPCVADTTEPNEGPTSADALGAIHDDDEVNIGQGTDNDASPKQIKKSFSLHDGADVDWFSVDVLDTGAGGNPQLSLVVGDGVEATAFFACANGKTQTVVCGLGTKVTDDPDLQGGLGCKTAKSGSAPPQLTMSYECDDTSSDNGTLRIRVKRAGTETTCLAYRLSLFAE